MALKLGSAAVCVVASLLSMFSHADNAVVKDGVVFEADGKEMRRFGVNYNTPFAFGYRSHQRLGVDHKAAIDMDVDHIARLGLDAYRVHIWDRELSDANGNLVDTHHLELFDYLMLALEKKGIKSIITPMAWWGNGYPEPDLQTGAFAESYTKSQMNEDPKAVKQTINFVTQLLLHKNRYTGKPLGFDENVIAFELFNEPKHKSDVEDSKDYVNKLISSARAKGVTKPLFYNISEQGDWREFADAICRSEIDGIAFQWYPTGLVKNSRLNTNVLFNVAKYHNPFSNLKACQNKGKMIYEFDAADVTRSVMYPAMARSLRAEGFQWATQFAYDPAATAHSNSEYNTHYLNLLYTPSKAISLMIAAEAFRQLPKDYKQSRYPKSNEFADFALDYHRDLATLNQSDRLIYTNDNDLLASDSVKHIAGVGQSKSIQYGGSGAYFLDKVEPGVWQLEVYPDVIKVSDPHLPGSLKRQVGALIVSQHAIKVDLKDLDDRFYFLGLNEGNNLKGQAVGRQFVVKPGIYLLSNKPTTEDLVSQIDSNYYLPNTVINERSEPHEQVKIWHQVQDSYNVSDRRRFSFNMSSPHEIEQAKIYVRYAGDHNFTQFDLRRETQNRYSFLLPEKWTKTGQLEYQVAVKTNASWSSYPGGVAGNPSEWDFVNPTSLWKTKLRPKQTIVELFNPVSDQTTLIYPKKGRAKWEFIAGENGLNQALKLGVEGLSQDNNWLARSSFAEDKSLSDKNLKGYKHLLIKIKAHSKREFVNFSLLNEDGLAFGTTFEVSNKWTYKFIELNKLKPNSTMLTKSYPMFLPIELAHQNDSLGDLEKLQGFQVRFEQNAYAKPKDNKWHGIEIELIALR
ncbi:hypothetical protein [Opacimonas viscosa]|uniref:Glycoside hydrolase family 5 domain-containing protein n=1 Tax=Opacimonas viscosa TaxID=2961944 RepID=A0AA41WVX7_9ALTE|nr:hypothetical protein [Opacimonas viscosa]MCP3427564.1 hypothetical protein [Opacimonas viscosa]